jgi:hypothetical protein
LIDVDNVIGKLTAKIQRYDEDITKEVRKHMREKGKVKANVKQAQSSIVVRLSLSPFLSSCTPFPLHNYMLGFVQQNRRNKRESCRIRVASQ